MPTFHNPLGTTTSLAHRRQLLAIAARCGKPVIEDAYEADLRFAGKPVPSLAALDASGLVVQLSSFSKSLFPGVARRRDRGARARRRRAARAQAGERSLGRDAAAGRARGVRRRAATTTGTSRACAACCSRAATRCSRRWPSSCPRARAGRRRRAAIRSGSSCRRESTRAICCADAVGAGVLFAPGSQFNHDGRAVARPAPLDRDGERGCVAPRCRGARARARGPARRARRAPRGASPRLNLARRPPRRRSRRKR